MRCETGVSAVVEIYASRPTGRWLQSHVYENRDQNT